MKEIRPWEEIRGVEQIQSITFNSKSKESSNAHKNFTKHKFMKTTNFIHESLKFRFGETWNSKESCHFIQHKGKELAYLQSLG